MFNNILTVLYISKQLKRLRGLKKPNSKPNLKSMKYNSIVKITFIGKIQMHTEPLIVENALCAFLKIGWLECGIWRGCARFSFNFVSSLDVYRLAWRRVNDIYEFQKVKFFLGSTIERIINLTAYKLPQNTNGKFIRWSIFDGTINKCFHDVAIFYF